MRRFMQRYGATIADPDQEDYANNDGGPVGSATDCGMGSVAVRSL